MFRDIALRLRSLFRRATVERELDQELRFHLEHEIAKNRARGLPENEAARQAKIDLGGLELVKEQSRDARGISFFETATRDIRYAVRVLRKSSGFTTVAILSLALGVGANTAIFQLIDAIRLRTLPIENPQTLAQIRVSDMRGARGSRMGDDSLTYALWQQVRKQQQSFSGVLAWSDADFNLSPKGEVRSAPGLWVSGGFFEVLGIRPALGRLFTPEDDYRGCGLPGAVISYSFWQSEFAGSRSALGKKVSIDGQPVEILGVTAPGFSGLDVGREFQIALPLCSIAQIQFNALDAGTFWWLSVMGRLKPGFTLEQAATQLTSVSPGILQGTLPANYPPVSVNDYLHMKLTARSAATGFSDLRDQYSDLLWLLLAIAGAVLLNACANLANLMLARAGTREREIAVRLAIGGSSRRIVQQLLIESALIAVAGAGAALLLARWLSRGLLALLTAKQTGIYVDLHQDWRVLIFTFAVAGATCLIFGLTPALRAAQSKPVEALKAGGRSLTDGHASLGLRRGLIASQVALSLVLLAGSLLFVRSLQNLLRAEPGFRTHGVFVADLGFARPNAQHLNVPVWQKSLLERVGSVPGVLSVAATDVVPLGGVSWSDRVWMDGRDSRNATDRYWSRVTPAYFQTLGIPLLAGRDFNEHDGPHSPRVAIVNAAFAREVALDSNPVGLTFHIEATPTEPETVCRIVGLVGDTKYHNLREPMRPLFYLPLAQDPAPTLSDQLLIRANLPLRTLLPAVQRAILNADGEARFQIYSLEDLVQSSLARERLMAGLSTVFAALAALLSAVGLYGVVTYIVTRRRSEIGIRIALGADRRKIFGLLFLESGKMLAGGLSIGILLTLAVATAAGKILFGLKPHDPLTLATASLLLLLIGLLATLFPALRAANTDPTAALREE